MKKVSPETLKVGDIVEQYIHFDKDHMEMKIPGEVIWIHPEKQFYRVRFKQPGGYCTESYRFYGKQSGSNYVGWEEKGKKRMVVEGEVRCNE